MSFIGGYIWSNVNLNASSSIRGTNYFNKPLDSSIHGLVLTSINHGFKYLSTIKS